MSLFDALDDATDLRPCICADPENCVEPVPGRVCRRVVPTQWQNDGVPDGSRWRLDGRDVIVRGASPACVWFTVPGASPLTQQTLLRTDFAKRAKRLD
jgi:hypothetical protein